MIWSIRSRGKWSFGQCLLRVVKSTHIHRISVSFLGTSTRLDTQVLSLMSLMKLASSSLLTLTPITSALPSDNRCIICLTGRVSRYMLSACSANCLGTPGMSTGHREKISQRSLRNSTSASSYAGLRLLVIRVVLVGSVGGPALPWSLPWSRRTGQVHSSWSRV